jgi:hypothetical protein
MRNRQQQSDHIYFTLLKQVLHFAVLPPASGNYENIMGKTTLLSQTSMSDFSSSNFIVQGGILSIAGCSDKTEENAIKYKKFCCCFLSTTTYQRF